MPIVARIPRSRPYILDKAAQKELGGVLLKQFPGLASLPVGEVQTFNFTTAHWKEWKPTYHQFKWVERSYERIHADGLMAAMAGFSLCALADGSVKAKGNGNFTITVTKIAVFVLDVFEFSESGKPLGFWSCKEGTAGFNPSHEDSVYITNNRFRHFRTKFRYGGDFLTLSKPHLVENFLGFSYDFS